MIKTEKTKQKTTTELLTEVQKKSHEDRISDNVAILTSIFKHPVAFYFHISVSLNRGGPKTHILGRLQQRRP